MPTFLPNLADLNRFTSAINPLNLFTFDESVSPTSQAPRPSLGVVSRSASSSAEAGPGPSTLITRRTSSLAQGNIPLSETAGPRRVSVVNGTESLGLGPVTGAGAGAGVSRVSPVKSALRPSRPTVEPNSHPMASDSSSDSIDGASLDGGPPGIGGRKSSGASVVLVDPNEQKEREWQVNKRSGSRFLSTSTGTGEGAVEGERPRRKKKQHVDTYIIVKPPPGASKNPLNLQVQLIVQKPARGRERTISNAETLRSPSAASNRAASVPSSPIKSLRELPTPNGNVADLSQAATGSEVKQDIPRSSSPSDDAASASSSGAGAGVTTAGATGLRRSSSLKSSISGVSGYSARSGTGSTAASISGPKRIEPMFNLTVHNMMQPTVVTDAATDAKVAKFHKRAIDIAGVGVIEPNEVWLPHPSSAVAYYLAQREESTPQHRASRPASMASFHDSLTPSMSHTSEVTPTKANTLRQSLDIKGDLRNIRDTILHGTNSSGQESGPKKFFGKIFKKKDNPELTALETKVHGRKSPHLSDPSHDTSSFSDNTLTASNGKPAGVSNEHASPMMLGHPTFGTSPTIVHRRSSDPLVSPDGAVTGLTSHAFTIPATPTTDKVDKAVPFHMHTSSRPVGYTFTVRKWAKRNTEGWAAHLVAAAAAGLDTQGVNFSNYSDPDDEVVFEWVKMKSCGTTNGTGSALYRTATQATATTAASGARSRSRHSVIDLESPATSRLSLPLKPRVPSASSRSASPFPPSSPNLSVGFPDSRPEPVRRLSTAQSSPVRPSTPVQDDAASVVSAAESDSDPEDSETPWTCSVWVKKTNHRQLLGTLSPAPHHPKVVAQLKIPTGLEAVSLVSALVDKGPAQEKAFRHKAIAKRVEREVCLTEEGLKDVVCVSAMWLVAREEFGGLGKKKKV